MEKYNHKKIEKKWQKHWAAKGLFEAKENKGKKKFYGLIEFPYPSGDGLHTGHLRSNTGMDIICRKRRMEGYEVLYPIGFDSFGLPAENYAVKKGVKPQISIAENIKIFTRQLKSAGFSFDWSRSLATTDEGYYRWTQWIFVEMFKKGLAYKKKENINWCSSCKIGLANEEVVAGECERCGAQVVKKEKEQWLLKITKYADRLIKDLDGVDYLEQIKRGQINWIGRSQGAEVDFKLKGMSEVVKVFTTRPDTLFGATFMVMAPEHAMLDKIRGEIKNIKEVEEYIIKAKNKSEFERADVSKEKTGVELKGIKVVNPVNSEEISLWLADYVMMGYGTGAIMAVPAHDERDFEFAKKYGLKITQVISGGDVGKEALTLVDSGKMINSGEFNGLRPDECIKKITQWLKEKDLGKAAVNYKLRDWIFSRQRYWGEPIPMICCAKCGWQAVAEKDLPVVLPDIDDFMPTDEGESPLSKVKDWAEVKCPKCKGEARRETDVMPNWAGSNWYFLRYADQKNSKALAGRDRLKYWLPVDWYNGGMEHTTLHLLYSRFVYKFLHDIGAVPKECGVEPYKKRTAHGMILGEGGAKMSKSRGNVVNPDRYTQEYGADTVRLYEMFMGPFDQAIAWDDKGVVGVYRFLNKVWELQKKVGKGKNKELERLVHQTIKKVGEDIENMRFNTAVAGMMIFVNRAEKAEGIDREIWEKFLLVLSPFAPHLAEELWESMGHKESMTYEAWPEYDRQLIVEDEIELVVQVNGKVRDKIQAAAGMSESEAKELALGSEKVAKWLAGKKAKKVIYIKNKLVSIVI